ncbi:MAG: AlpA family phage regulatory protein [Nitrospinae bacterium]|nr:AlpA family phage regulatory protein [Nitrospinota bacterium]
MSEAILRWKQVKELVNLSRVTCWRLERRGLFPGRVTLGSNSCGWRLSEISAWLESRPRVGQKVGGGK